jgi:hypothetical protein
MGRTRLAVHTTFVFVNTAHIQFWINANFTLLL